MGVSGGRLGTVEFLERDDGTVEEGRYTLVAGPDVVDEGTYVVVHRPQAGGSWAVGGRVVGGRVVGGGRWAVDILDSDRPVPAG